MRTAQLWIVAVFLLAGCFGGGDSEPLDMSPSPTDGVGGNNTTGGGPGGAGGNNTTACDNPMGQNVFQWQLPANYQPTGGSGTETFDVPVNSMTLLINESNGQLVQATWTFTITDANGTVVWEHDQSQPTTGFGENVSTESGQVSGPQPGTYTFDWEAMGEIGNFEVVGDVEHCMEGAGGGNATAAR